MLPIAIPWLCVDPATATLVDVTSPIIDCSVASVSGTLL
jgi:hypothetical protein